MDIKVKLKSQENIKVHLKPKQSIKLRNKNVYVYDPNIIGEYVSLAEDWAIKTDGLVEEEDYSSKAYAIGGQGTETNNSKYYAEQAGISETNASNSATAAATSATNASIWAEGTDSQVSDLGGEKSSKGWAERAKELVDSIGTVLHYKGSVATYSDLPSTGQEVGDVWNVLSDGSNYAWDGTDWDDLSGIVDLSAYRTSADQDIIDLTKASIDLSNLSATGEAKFNAKQDVISDLSTIRSGAALGATAVQPSDLAVVATSGSYTDLSDKPTIPTVNNSTITITQGGVTKGSFTLNQATNETIDVDVGGSIISTDGVTIDTNADDELQAIGVIDDNTSNPIKTWTGTKAQYDAIVTKDSNTLYNITDDVAITSDLLASLYPVGSIYITTANTCPLSTLIAGSTWALVGSGTVLQGADSGHNAGTTIEAGLPNIVGSFRTSGANVTNRSGSFSSGSSYQNNPYGGTSGNQDEVLFDASLSSSIYGNSTTVQPPAYVVNIFERTA